MRVLREPLLHFLLAGALLFGAYDWRHRADSDDGDRTIRITEREVAWLSETWTRQSQRPPSDVELQGLIAEYLREELLSREARGLELDRDDVVVRRRLAQKMTFLIEDTANLASPTEDELRVLYAADRARFEAPAQVSLLTVYFSTDERGDRAPADARAALEKLRAGGRGVDPAAIGDRSLLPTEMQAVDEQAIAGTFGREFARTVIAMEPGDWQGPIDSSFGLHLVRVTARREPEPRRYEAVREELLEEWRRRAQETAKQAYFSGLLERYDIAASDGVQALIVPALAMLGGDAR